MSTIEYLEQVKNHNDRIALLRQEIEEITARTQELSAMSYGQTKVRSSGREDRMDLLLDKLNEKTECCRQKILQLDELICETADEIARLDNLDEVMCLMLKYVRLMPWKDVAEVMGISERHLRRIRDRGVEHLEKLREGH